MNVINLRGNNLHLHNPNMISNKYLDKQTCRPRYLLRKAINGFPHIYSLVKIKKHMRVLTLPSCIS